MFHVIEYPDPATGGRLEVKSDDDLGTQPADPRAAGVERGNGFRTALDAVVYLIDLASGRAACTGRRRAMAW